MPRIVRARDLGDNELWELSLGRSRARRRAAELRFVPTGSRAKRLSLGTLAALTVGPASSLGEATAARRAAAFLPPTTTEHTVTLESGSTGTQVRQLQAALHIKSDGDYGPETEAAVYQYQATHGLPVDGVAGPKTTTALASDAPTKKPSQRGAIAMVQAQLGVQVDGEFGPETYEAIKAFQASRNIAVDAVVGPQTWKALHLTGDETLNPPPSAIPQPKVIPAVVTSSGGTEAGAEGAAPPSGEGEPVARPAVATGEGQSAEGDGGTASEAPPTQAAAPQEEAPQQAPSQEAPTQAAPEEAPSAPAGGGEEHHSEEHSSSEGHEGSGSEGSSGAVRRVIAAGNEIATRPYEWGGGHGSFQSNGYDCSGSVSYALHGAGLIKSPETSGELEHYGESGPGKHITIYANSEHAYMEVNGRRYDTVALAEHGSRWSNSSGHDGGSFVARHPAGQ
jgi:peptidoglycan hydrolase-like protein with peptidoglycan-binding domain